MTNIQPLSLETSNTYSKFFRVVEFCEPIDEIKVIYNIKSGLVQYQTYLINDKACTCENFNSPIVEALITMLFGISQNDEKASDIFLEVLQNCNVLKEIKTLYNIKNGLIEYQNRLFADGGGGGERLYSSVIETAVELLFELVQKQNMN